MMALQQMLHFPEWPIQSSRCNDIYSVQTTAHMLQRVAEECRTGIVVGKSPQKTMLRLVLRVQRDDACWITLESL